jgi:pyruvate-ferredoxin/flavodoxin oxidoreductase
MIMQSVFFKLADIMDIEKAKEALKQGVLKNYGLKGEKVVQLNYAAIDAGFSDSNLMEVKYPESWGKIESKPVEKVESSKPNNEHEEFVQKLFNPVHGFKGNDLPVSAFDGFIAGQTPTGTSKYEKRGVANNIPIWHKEHCIKCNICSFVCPQAAIRPFLMTDEEAKKAEELGIDYLKGVKQTKDYNFRVQVSPFDCLDCGVCVRECPKEGALQMTSVKDIDVEKEHKKWEYVTSLPNRGEEFKTNTIVGSQFQQPLLEFTGACNGCPEATYMKVLTQLFGDRMMLANAAGCSIVWCGTFPSAAYTVNEKGHGPSWGFSLFEDNAEYGFGMAIAAQQKRTMLKRYVQNMLAKNVLPNEKRQLFQDWLENYNKGPISKKLSLQINDWMTTEGQTLLVDSDFAAAYELRDMFTKPSVWIIGGDGFAYDIGSAGLDHVLSMDVDINVLVLDNQSYANTGFQMSKSTPYGTKAKFAALGKRTQKKDLGMTMMQYGHVYVAQIASGANMAQTLRALHEAEEHPGPSLVIAYCPCQGQGLSRGMSFAQTTMKEAVESGFWNIYRYDPKKEKPFTLDSKELKRNVKEFLKNEVRYSSLMIQHPEMANELQEELERQCIERFNKLKKLEASQ